MTDSHNSNMHLSQEQLEVFRVLYPIFKEEVFRRREHMIRLATFHNAFLVLLLVTILAVSPGHSPDFTTRWLAISGIAVFSGFFAYLILQQAARHRMAKQQLIELEKGVGLYQENWYLNGKTAYPENWQTDWAADRSVIIYLAVLTSLTALVMCAMLIRP
jgi:hypothetical protein